MRDMLFVSHANPEDNGFARWLSLQLASHGYPVWCDLTKLLGGEVFWDRIEAAIRERTLKFLYVLSRVSNSKPGVRDELDLARRVQKQEKLKDFVVPLRIDDLSPPEFNVEIGRLNAIGFSDSWAKGLNQLLAKLEEDRVPRKDGFNPSAVTSWWREQFAAGAGVKEEPEDLLSNVFPLKKLPALRFHQLHAVPPDPPALVAELPYPAVPYGRFLVSFAGRELLQPGAAGVPAQGLLFKKRRDSKRAPHGWTDRDEWSATVQLLRAAWLRMIREKGMPQHAFANEAVAFYFTDGAVGGNRLPFEGVAGKRTWRQVVGFKTIKGKDEVPDRLRYWHFAIQAKPVREPVLGYLLKAHVLFSDDGKTIWESPRRLQTARRSQCRDWWNDDWRDRVLAVMSWLAGGSEVVQLQAGKHVQIGVDAAPLTLTAPVSFDDTTLDREKADVEADEIEEWDDEEDDDGDDEDSGGGR